MREPISEIYPSQSAMRFGPRSYTPQQARVIESAVRERTALRVPPAEIECRFGCSYEKALQMTGDHGGRMTATGPPGTTARHKTPAN
jgi:hypothetical protein